MAKTSRLKSQKKLKYKWSGSLLMRHRVFQIVTSVMRTSLSVFDSIVFFKFAGLNPELHRLTNRNLQTH